MKLKNEWVSVKERLPGAEDISEDGDVLACWGGDEQFLALAYCGADDRWFQIDDPRPLNVTHWMRLPKPPEHGGAE